jgi:hypothetical protein
MAHRLDDAEGNADAVNEKGGDEPVQQGDGQAVGDDVEDGLVVAVRVAEVAAHDLAQPEQVGLEGRPVEAVVGLELGHLLLGDRAAPDLVGLRPARVAHPRFHQGPLDRPARHHPGDQEDDQRDAQEGRGNQQEAAEKVVPHAGGE